MQSLKITQTFHYTNDEITKRIDRKKKMNVAVGSAQTRLAVERADLVTKRDVAKDRNDREEEDKINKLIQEIDRKINSVELDLKGQQNKDAMAAINQRNLEKNIKSLGEDSGDVSSSAGGTFNPFSRRKNLPAKFAFTKSAQEEELQKQQDDQQSQVQSDSQEQKSEVVISTETPEDILKQAHNFDLNSPLLGKLWSDPTSKSNYNDTNDNQSAKRPTLSIDDYKRRRGLL